MTKTNVIILGSKKFIESSTSVFKKEGKNVNSTTEPSLFKTMVEKSNSEDTEYIIEEKKIQKKKGLFSSISSLFSGPQIEMDFIANSDKLNNISTLDIEKFEQLLSETSTNKPKLISTPESKNENTDEETKQSTDSEEIEKTPENTESEEEADEEDFDLDSLIASTQMEEEEEAEEEEDDENFDIEALLKAAESGDLPTDDDEETPESTEGLEELLSEEETSEETLEDLIEEEPELDEPELEEPELEPEEVPNSPIKEPNNSSIDFEKHIDEIREIKKEVNQGLEDLKEIFLQQQPPIDTNIDLTNSTAVYADLENLNNLFGKLIQGDAIVFQLKSKVKNVIKNEVKLSDNPAEKIVPVLEEEEMQIDADSILSEVSNHHENITSSAGAKSLNPDDLKKEVLEESHSERREKRPKEQEVQQASLEDIMNETVEKHNNNKEPTTKKEESHSERRERKRKEKEVQQVSLEDIMNETVEKHNNNKEPTTKKEEPVEKKENIEDMLKEILGE